MQWVMAKDAAEHTIMRRTAPHKKSYPAQSVNNAEGEKPCSKRRQGRWGAEGAPSPEAHCGEDVCKKEIASTSSTKSVLRIARPE